MGYVSRLEGEIAITPPLNWREVRSLPDKYLKERQDNSLVIKLNESVRDTDDGEVIVRSGSMIASGWEDEVRHYHVLEELDEIVKACPGHEYCGYLHRYGEDPTDVERYWVADGRARSEVAEVVARWPDGSEDSQRAL